MNPSTTKSPLVPVDSERMDLEKATVRCRNPISSLGLILGGCTRPSRWFTGLVVVQLVTLLCPFLHAEVLDVKFNSTTGNYYYLLSQSTWTAAEREAVSLGGHLVTIDTAAEQSWVYSGFTNNGLINRALWIGLRDSDQATNSADRAARRMEFNWVSQAVNSYTNWSSFEPNNPASGDPFPGEFFVHIWHPGDGQAGKWNNITDVDSVFGVPIQGVVEVSLPVVPQLLLTLESNQAVLRWRVQPDHPMWSLHSSQTLANQSWSKVTQTPAAEGAFWVVRQPIILPSGFFRLQN